MTEQSITVHRMAKMANYFLVVEGEELTLIDTGNKEPIDNVRGKFERRGHDLNKLRRIVITHSHFDHTGNVATLVEATGAKVMAHETEIPYITQEKSIPQPGGFSGLLFRVIEPLFRATPAKVDVALKDGDTIEGTGLKVIHVPGHTPGSICLYHPEARALFTGDCIIGRGNKLRGPIPAFSSDIKQARRSVGKLAELDIETIYFHHGETMRDVPKDALQSLYSSLKK